MNTQPLRRYHASHHEFDFPDYEKMVCNKTGHDNGLLGLWVSVKSDWIEGFGPKVYEMDIEGTSKDLSITQLHRWAFDHADDPDFYRGLRQQLLAEGVAYLRLVESDGRSEMGVIVDFDVIQDFRRMDEPKKTPKAIKPR